MPAAVAVPPKRAATDTYGTSGHLGTVWLWTIDLSHRDRRFPNHGYEATREAAIQAFAKSWHREA
jgi:hypothetical protein